jgi:hypothetical protein
VVGSVDVGPDEALAEGLPEPLREEEVVQPPPNVLRPTVELVGPEAVGILEIGVELTEAVKDLRLLQQLTQALTLLLRETSTATVRLRILQIWKQTRNTYLLKLHIFTRVSLL